AVVAIEKIVAFEEVGERLDHEEETEKDRAVRDGGARNPAPARIEHDLAGGEIDERNQDRAQHDERDEPVLDRDQERQREKIEAEVVAEERIGLSVRHLLEEAEREAPAADGGKRHEDADDDGDDADKALPGQAAQETLDYGREFVALVVAPG